MSYAVKNIEATKGRELSDEELRVATGGDGWGTRNAYCRGGRCGYSVAVVDGLEAVYFPD